MSNIAALFLMLMTSIQLHNWVNFFMWNDYSLVQANPRFYLTAVEKKNNFLISGSGLGTRLEQFCFSCTYEILAPHLNDSICISFIYSVCGRNQRWFHCICAWITSLCLKHCILVKDRAHICFVVAPDTPVPMKFTQRCPKWKFSIVWR